MVGFLSQRIPFAVDAAESYRSDISHDNRSKFRLYTPELTKQIEDQQKGEPDK